MYKKETSLSNNDKEESKPSRLQSLQNLIDGVHMLLKDATAHGRILVGPTDESGIGDEVFPAWARRQVDINLAAATTEEENNVSENNTEDIIMQEDSTSDEDDTASVESSILSLAPPQVNRYEELKLECKKLLDHDAKIKETELILYPPPPIVVKNEDDDELEEEEEEIFEPLLPLITRNELLVTLVRNSNPIVPFYHSKCGISEKRSSRSLVWGEKILEMGMVGHPGGPINKPERFSMFDGTFCFPLEQTISPYITLLPELTYDPYEAEMERRRIYQEKLRIEKLIREEEERERLAEMKEFLRKRRAAKESLSEIWKKPTWIKDFRGEKNNGNGYNKEFSRLSRKKHATNYSLTSSPFDAIGPKKMKKVIEKCNEMDIKQPRKYIKKMYAKYYVIDDRIGPPNAIVKYTAPGAADMDFFIQKLGIGNDFTLAYEILGVNVDDRGGLLPFDVFMNNTIAFSLLSPMQLIAYVFYIVPDLEEQSEGYLLRNMHKVINMLHGTKKYPVLFPKLDEDDSSDSDMEAELFLDESILFSKVRENKDKMNLAVDILNKLPADATHVELIEALLDFPILLWPAFHLQEKVRRKLCGDLYWKSKIVNDNNLVLLQKQVREDNIKKRKIDKKNRLKREKQRRKMLKRKRKKNKKQNKKQESKKQIVVTEKLEQKVLDKVEEAIDTTVTENEQTDKEKTRSNITSSVDNDMNNNDDGKQKVTPTDQTKVEKIHDKDEEGDYDFVVEEEIIYEEVENASPKLLQLSTYMYLVRFHEMSERASWGLTARTLLVAGASRRHAGALISSGLLANIFGRSRTKQQNILLIQIWWKLLTKRRRLQAEVDDLQTLIENDKRAIKEKQTILANSKKANSKMQREIKKLKKNVLNLEKDVAEILSTDSFAKNMKTQIQEMEVIVSKRVAKNSNTNNIKSPEIAKDIVDEDDDEEDDNDHVIRRPEMVLTSEISHEFREGYCIVPHCNTLINLADPEESIGICPTCRIYAINYWAMKEGYKWGYRLIKRIEDTVVREEPDHLECNSWMLFRDSLVRSNFYFNIDTGHSRWELASWHKKNKKSFKLVKDEPVLVWERQRAEKEAFRRKVIAAKLAKAEAMKKKGRRRPAYQKKK